MSGEGQGLQERGCGHLSRDLTIWPSVPRGLEPVVLNRETGAEKALHVWWVVAGKNGDGSQGGRSSLAAQTVKNPPATQETGLPSLGRKDPLEKGMATHSSVLAWGIPRTEGPGRAQGGGGRRADPWGQPGVPQVEALPIAASLELALFPPLVWAPEEGAGGH